MPFFNSQLFIGASIKSALSQTHTNLELICIDDNSTDDTYILIENLLVSDNRIVLLKNPKKGVANARNYGIEQSTGELIAFLDSDDIWLPKKLELHLSFMQRMSAAISHTSYRRVNINENTETIRNCAAFESYQSMLVNNGMGCSTVIYDTRIVGKVYMPDLKKRQDWATWLYILRSNNNLMSFGYDKVLTVYTERHGSISSSRLDLVYYTYMVYRSVEINVVESIYRTVIYTFRKVIRKNEIDNRK